MTIGELRKALEGVADDKVVFFLDKDFYANECSAIDVNYDGVSIVMYSAELKYFIEDEEDEAARKTGFIVLGG